MNTCKKLLSLVVASVMLVGMVPTSALANPGSPTAVDQAALEAQAQAAQQQTQAEAAARQAAYEEAARQAAEQAAKQAQQQQAQINQQQQAQQSQSWQQIDQVTRPEVLQQQNAQSAPVEQSQEQESEDKTEEKYPERTVADISLGNGAVLSVFVPEGALAEKAQVKVSSASVESQRAAKAILADAVEGELTQTKNYQISFVEDGKEVSPKKDVKLTFKGVTMYGEKAALYAVGSDAKKLAGPTTIPENGGAVTLTANTAKAGTYVLAASRAPQQAEEEQEQTDEEADEDPQAEPTETPAATDGLSDEDKAAVADALRSMLSLTAVPVSEEAAAEETKEDAAEEAKVNYPAFETSQAVAGTSMTVNVSAPEGAFPEGIQLSATAVSTPADVLAAIKADNGEVSNDDIVSVDVHFYLPDNSGAEIEPKVPVNVTFSNIGIEADTVDVYHEADKIAEIPADGATLALDQFSTYTFVANDGTAKEADNTEYKIEIPDQNLKLDANKTTATIDVAAIAKMYKMNSETGDWEDYTFDSQYWDISASGVSCSLSGWTISATGLGSSTVTVSHKGSSEYWTNKPLSVTFNVNVSTEVTYDGNGADEGQVYTVTYSSGNPGLQPQGSFTKDGYYFAGWATSASATEPEFQPGGKILENELYGKTVFAVWKQPERINIYVDRAWDDDNDRDGLRSVTDFTITGTTPDGTVVYERTGLNFPNTRTKTYQVSQGDGGNTDKFMTATPDGTPITYTVTATHQDKTADDYTVTVTDDGITDTGTPKGQHFTITNTHEPEKYGPISVTKVWDDDNNRDGKRPTSIQVQVKRDDETVRQSNITEADSWSKTLSESNTKPELAYYKYHDGGTPYTYTVVERNLPEGYEQVSIEGGVESGFTITNKHTPEKINITATKVWDDADDQDGIRPATVYAKVYKEGQDGAIRTMALSETNNWQASFTRSDLYRYENGQPVVYTIKESARQGSVIQPIEGYEPTVTTETDDETGDISVTFTNKHEPEMRTLTVTKSWEGEVNGDASRRSDVTVNIKADGTPINEQLVITGDASATTWTNTLEVDKYTFDPETGKGGHEITYTVEEQDVPFYRNDGVEGDMDAGFTLTNTYIPNTTTVTIEKVWKDAQDADDKRPDGVHLLLMNNGKIERESWVREADNWTVTFTDVPVFVDAAASDKTIDYKVEEENNAGYIVTVAEDEKDAIKGYTYKVTNTMPEAGKIDIPVEKIWKDDSNRDGLRPESVDVTLQAGGEDVADLTIKAEDGWKGTFTDIPAVDIDTDQPIVYSLVEKSAVDGYKTVIEGNQTEGFTVTNTHKPEEIPEIKATKVWDDANNQDGIRPQNIYLRLYKADGTPAGKQKALNGDQTECTFTTSQKTPIYKYENGKEIEYTIVESANRSGDPVPVDGYEMTSVTGSAAEGFVVTNTHKLEIREITVTKEWDDNDNQDGIRPSEIYVALYDGDNRLRQRALNEANGWTTTITAENQYKYKPGEQGTPIEYTVEESWVQGTHKPEDPSGKYTYVSTEGDMDAGFTITNKHVPELVDINVTKEWDDDNDRDSKQPEEITIILRADGEEVARGTATAAGTDPWTYSFTDMPVYKNGDTIAYTVSEDYDEDYANYYYMSVSDPDYQVVADGNDQLNYTITNKYGPEETTVPVVKRWDDNNNQDGLRPESVTVTLKADGEPAKDAAGNVITATLSEANSWAHYFEGVPKNVKESTGSRAIKYTVEETGYKMAGAEEVEGTPDGYKVTYSDYADNADFTITNTHKPEEVRYHIVKKWEDDNDRDGIRPETVSFTLESYTGEWNEAEGKPGDDFDLISSEEIMLSARSDSHDKNTWDRYIEVPKYANGAEIKYYLAETVPQGYTADQEAIVLAADADNTFTNSYTPELVEIPVTKVWDDSDNQDGLRPTSVRAFVYANGEYAKRQTELSESNSWTATIKSTNATKLYKYDENGKEIKYTVKESSSGGSVKPIKNYTSKVTGSVEEGFTITNTHEAETIDVTVRKDWDDADDQDGKRPESLEIQLLADGEKVGEAVRIGLADNWEKVYEDLPAYKNGTAIKYTATETVPTGYTQSGGAGASVSENSGTITLKNTYSPEKVDINVTKIWDDDNNHDKKRPGSVSYTLFADTVPVKTVELTTADAAADDANKWEKTIAGQPKYSNGKEIAYTIGEKPVTDYTTTYETSMTEATTDSNKAFNFTVTNKYEPGKTTITVQKVWDDADDQDGKRPESVTAKLQFKCPADNMNDWIDHPEQPALKLNEAGDWKGTWDVYTQRVETGSDLEFNVVETGVPAEYTSSVKSDGDLFTITNKHVPEKGLIAIEKTWTDDNDRDGKRPNSVTIDILGAYLGKDGNAHVAERFDFTINKSTANNGDVWFDVVEVPKYCDGSEIIWTAIEKAIDGYEPQGAIGTVGGLVLEYYKQGINKVENKHEPELVKIPVTKVWDDNDDQDGKRPDKINLHVVGYAGKKEVIRRDVTWPKKKTSSTITKDNSLKAPLYKYYEGQEIRYEVTEDAVEDYTTAVTGNVEDGFTITNTHEPATANLTVNKKWDDKDNQDGKRPEYLEITLTNNVDNTEKTVRMGLADNWSYTFENLPVYKGGNAIKYSVSEVVPAGYMPVGEEGSTEATLENGDATITIKNQYTPETMTINVMKTWVDENDNDDVRPGMVEYTIFANDVPVKNDFLTEDDSPDGLPNLWSATYEDMPVYENGKKIAYTIAERSVDDYTSKVMTEFIDATDENPAVTIFHITNTHTPGMKTITVVKEWDDGNNQDGLRPEEISYTITGTTESNPAAFEASDTLSEANDWMASYDVHVMDNGEVIQYEVEETGYKMEGDDEATEGVPEGYEVSYSDAANSGNFTIKNTHTPETGIIAIQKTWDDDNNRDGKRPTSVTFDIYGTYWDAEDNPHIFANFEFTINESTNSYPNDWGNMIEVPKYIDGNEIYYTATERTVPEYEPQGAIAEDGGLELDYLNLETGEGINEVVNKHTPELVTIDVAKVWDDADNQDGVRPDEVYAVVYANGEKVRQRALNEANGWKTTITAQRQYKYEKGKEIKYEVFESWVKGTETRVDPKSNYTSEITGSVEEGFTFTNIHEPKKIDVTVTKTWDDANDQDGKRPEYLEVKLLADGTEVASERLSASNNWKHVFEGLDAYKEGTAIVYTATETVPEGYEQTPGADTEVSVESGTIALENKYTPEEVVVHVDKVWEDKDNRDAKRPEEILYTLYADNVAIRTQAVHEAEDWKFDFGGADDTAGVLPKYADGKEIAYDVIESPVADYTTVKDVKVNAEGEPTVTFTNTYKPGVTTITAIKEWDDDNNRDGIRPESVEVTLTDKDGKSLELVDVNKDFTIELSEENNWQGSWDVYTKERDSGEDIDFAVEEDTTDTTVFGEDLYTVSYAETNNIFTVKNAHTPKTSNIDVEKNWVDNSNQDGIRPQSIIFRLMANGKLVSDRVLELSAANAVDENTWAGTFTDLPVFENGEEIIYSVEEDQVEGYTPEIGYVGANHPHTHIERTWVWQLNPFRPNFPGYWDETEVEDGAPRFIVVNTYEPETTNIAATKTWDDGDDQDGFRELAQAAFRLRIKAYVNGAEVPFEQVLVDAAMAQDDIEELVTPRSLPVEGSVSWLNVPKYHKGHVVEYKVEEVVNEGTTIIIPIINIPITFGAATEEQRDAAAKYTMTSEMTAENVWSITNTHVPETGSLSVIKEWDDNENQDGFRPDSLQVTLSSDADPDLDADVGLSAANGWTYTWDDLPMYNNGELVKYTVTEVKDGTWVEHYEIDESSADDLTLDTGYDAIITNIHEPETMTIEVDKVWNDASNQDGKRPADGAKVTLLADGTAVKQGVFEGAADNESLSFSDLPVYANGKKIVYTVAEQAIKGYTADIEARPIKVDPDTNKNKQVFQITNSYDPEMMTVTVTKAWEDEENVDGIRPEKVTFELTGKTEENPAAFEASNYELNAENGWTTTIDVPVMNESYPIDYEVKETPVPTGYVASYSDLAESGYFTITNTHKVKRVNHTVIVKWEDNNDQDGNRPEYVNVYLMKDGERTSDPVVTLSAANGWTYTWTNLPAGKYTTTTDPDTGETTTEESTVGYSSDEILKEDEKTVPDSGDSGIPKDASGGVSADIADSELTPYEGTYTKKSAETTSDADGNTTTTIVNEYTPKKFDIVGKKIWEDESNQDGVRPESIKINLYADGALIDTKEVTAETADPENGDIWNYEFKDLPRYIDGRLVHYQVLEEAIPNYTPRVVGYDIYNTYTPGKTFTTVIKLWDDDLDRDGIRPDNVIVRLLANGEEVNRASISLASGWFTIWTDLDVNSEGAPIEYSVTEDPVEGYTTEVTGDAKAGFTVKNTHTSERIDVPVKKVWEDDNNKKKLRPQSITVNLLVNGVKVDSHTLTEADGWKTTFEDMPKYANGLPINYVISEDEVPGYYATVSGDTITNTLRELCPNYCAPNSGVSGGGSITAVKTGDESSMALMIFFLLVGALAITQAVVSRRRARR